MEQDFGLKMVPLADSDLQAVEHPPIVEPYQWKDKREDDQKEEYMAYIRLVIPLDEHTGICSGGTSSHTLCAQFSVLQV